MNEGKAEEMLVDVDLRRDACEFGKVTSTLFCDVISMLATRRSQDASDVISGDAHLLGRPTLDESGRPSDKANSRS